MKNIGSKIGTLLPLATLAAALFGCGPNIAGSATTNAQLVSPDSYNYTAVGDYSCPTTANVLPYEDRLFDGTQRYTVCAHQTSTTKIRISGYSSSSANICVYPLQFLDDTHFVYKMGATGLPMYTCYNAQTSQTKEFDFQQTTYDGVAITDQANQGSLSRCLVNGSACPTYSIGQFR